MVSSAYLSSRKKWTRPQIMIFANNSEGIVNGVPQITGTEREDFIILSDHNRSEFSVTTNRIENRKRMINGHMRSYHIADKINLSFNYNLIPSRSYSGDPDFDENGLAQTGGLSEYTADGGAGGAELLKWYNDNPGSFYVFMSYDLPQNFTANPYENLGSYSDVMEVYFSNFSYDVVKRGGTNHDLWNLSISLEEV